MLGIDPLAPQGDLLPPDPAGGSRARRGRLRRRRRRPTRCITSATSAQALDRIARSCGPAGRSCSTSIGWDLAGRADARLALQPAAHARGSRAGRRRRPRSTTLREEWEAAHLGLHGFEALRTEVDARFDERAFVRAPFLYRLLGGVATEVLEQALIDAGAIQALAFPLRRRRPPPGRVTRASPESGMPERLKRGSSRGESRPDRERAARLLTLCGRTHPRCRRLPSARLRPARPSDSHRGRPRRSGATGSSAGTRALATGSCSRMRRWCATSPPARCGSCRRTVTRRSRVCRPRRAAGGGRPLRPRQGRQLRAVRLDPRRRRARRRAAQAGLGLALGPSRGPPDRAGPRLPSSRARQLPTEAELAAELGTDVDGLRAALEDIERSDVASLNAPARGADDAAPVEIGETIQAPEGGHEPEHGCSAPTGAPRCGRRSRSSRSASGTSSRSSTCRSSPEPRSAGCSASASHGSRRSSPASACKLQHQLATYDTAAAA